MITANGYKAFHGVMRITPKTKMIPATHVETDWIYNPNTHSWYGNNAEYSAEICTVVLDYTEKIKPKKTTNRQHAPSGELVFGLCPACNGLTTTVSKYCEDCGQKLDWGE